MSEQIDMSQLNEALKQLKETAPKKKISGFAKKLSYAIIIIAFVIGIGGSFEDVPFNMEAYVSFLPMFSALFIPLIVSIGVNSAVQKHEETEVEKERVRNGN